MSISFDRIAFAVAAAFLVASAGGSLHAEWITSEYVISPFVRTSELPPGVTASDAKDEFVTEACPNAKFEYSISYPRGMDGGGPVDRAIIAMGQEYVAAAQSRGETFLANVVDDCEPDMPAYTQLSYDTVTSRPVRVSSAAYAVMFVEENYFGGNHSAITLTAVNLLDDGSEITLGRLFPDPARSLPLLWEHVFRGFCRDHDTAPIFYGSQPCGSAVPPVPDPLKSPGSGLGSAGAAVLTGRGLSIHLSDYAAYSYAEGIQFLDIPSDALIGMGADRTFWQ
ncbi:MAG: hypothetical protein LBT40_13785 [Deltaproteobacteria bacterium]|jgi:hypothetical protein|nr:hypothetical protein [Deltaproteobacteria bacterium]